MNLKNNFKTLARITLNSIVNIFVLMLSLLVHRDDKSVLFGAWMGERFADNSRFLYQYLSKNKVKYGLNRVIWVTRNEDLNRELNDYGFESYLIGTRESTYWHLKTGIHIICNMAARSGIYLPDIDVKLSTGAKKVQLWHGVGIKAVGATANSTKNRTDSNRSSWLIRFANTKIIRRIGFLGGWGEPKILCTSELNKAININNSRIHAENAFISAYPRYCKCTFTFPCENSVIDTIQKYSVSLLYLPTFRGNDGKYENPTNNPSFLKFLEDNNILWIQKRHQADNSHMGEVQCKNVLELDPLFDINTLLETISAVVSDYSSAAFDAIFLNKPSIMYVPDIDEYMQGPNGLIYDLRDMCPSLLVYNCEELEAAIDSILKGNYFIEERSRTISKIKNEFFKDNSADYSKIWLDILSAIKVGDVSNEKTTE